MKKKKTKKVPGKLQKMIQDTIAKSRTLTNLTNGIWRLDCLFFVFAFMFYESIFKCTTIRTGYGMNLLMIFLYSAVLGNLTAFLTAFLRDKAKRIVRIVLLILLMIPYGVEYFIFREYNIFYDVKTIINGAGGAATGFMDEIIRLVFSLNGITLILMLAVPAIIYCIFCKKYDKDIYTNWMQRIGSLCIIAVLGITAVSISRLNKEYARTYTKEYSFPSAIEKFGLMTALRLDISKGSDADGLDFVIDEPEPVVTETTAVTTCTENTDPSVTTTTEVTYGKNVLDIDFAELAETESGTYASLAAYVNSLKPSGKNEYTGIFEGKNLIFITAEAFSREAIRKDITPTLYRLMTTGIRLKDYYQQASAGTTGGEFQNLFGLLPMKGGASVPSFTGGGNTHFTMGSQLNRLGYWGKAYHNNSATFYNRNTTHNKLGYSEGFMGYGTGMEKYVKYEWPESDLDMITGTMEEYLDQEHFNVYYMSVSGHSGYSYYGNRMSQKNWDAVKDMTYSDTVKAYFAANIELDRALEALVSELEKRGLADDTVICISPDHFPYGLDDNAAFGHMQYLSELYGYNVENIIQRDHNAAVIWCGCLEDEKQVVINTPSSALDLVPTLSNLFGLDFDSRLFPGRDVLSDAEPLYFDRDYNWKTDKGYYLSSTQTFYPNHASDVVSDEYIERIKAIVRNKVNYCKGVIDSNYFAHLFPVS
ncbi:MAG: sulfatase-like hydrolase/transferase [Oscillospiraceae bacterium]|nr:sulfatase-like hydrolase/transferase [Oscillospiraceae bacterium]